MTMIERGKVQGGAIVFSTPLPLPEGAEVVVRIESVEARPSAGPQTPEGFVALPFFGMWADRTDIGDSTAYVRGEREQWQHRARRQD